MKTSLLATLCLLFVAPVLYALDHKQTAPLYDHLCEVNAEWKKQPVVAGLLDEVNFFSDRERIQKHLELVENELRTRNLPSHSPAQKALRLHHLDVLRIYRQRGIFPINRHHAARQPYFRDGSGVLCAVGYLMWENGRHALVNRINRENNYGYIDDLARRYPELGVWAQENGFSPEELAWIQPGYEPIKPALQAWGNGGGLNPGGRINVLAKDVTETRLFAAGSFSQIDGLAANNIAVWDGANWHKLGDGVVGEIFALGYQKTWNTEKLYVAGDFYLPGQPTKQNVAEYDLLAQTWKGLQTGDMEGSVRTLSVFYSKVYFGGEFQKVNGTASPYFAQYNSYNNTWNAGSNGLTLDGPVYTLCDVDGYLLLGGAFQKAFPDEDGNWLDSPHLVYYLHSDFWTPFNNNLPTPVRALAYNGGNVYTGHKIEPTASPFEVTPALNVLQAGLWHLNSAYPAGDSVVHGFVHIGEHLLAYGGFFAGAFTYGSGMVTFGENNTEPLGYLMADSTVRAAIHFKNFVYLTGDFQHLWDETFPGMASIYAPLVAAHEPTAAIPVRVSVASNRLVLQYESLSEKTRLSVYDLNGRLLTGHTLLPGEDEWMLDAPSDWASEMYIWQLQNSAGTIAGKWVVSR